MRLKDKAIIVTGSTTGIGLAIAERCVAEGARVLLHGLEENLGKAAAARLGPQTLFSAGDLADPTTPSKLVAAAVAAFGKLDALVNNAAFIPRSNLSNTSVELFDKIIAINVRAPFLLIQAAHPHLQKTRGCVLNIGSINAYCGEEQLLPYSISKGALMTLSRNLGDALHAGASSGGPATAVRVNQFNVGWTLTENERKVKIADGLPPDWPEKLPRSQAPSGRILKPEEVAAHAAFWLSDESRPISGCVLDLEQYPVVGRNPTKEV
jgi:NAD(P)-dependent dehydrogenase (short-subunit alcohol dehydrogenase family)